jgi:hypothetical protein
MSHVSLFSLLPPKSERLLNINRFSSGLDFYEDIHQQLKNGIFLDEYEYLNILDKNLEVHRVPGGVVTPLPDLVFKQCGTVHWDMGLGGGYGVFFNKTKTSSVSLE